MRVVRQLPDVSRTSKRLFRKIVATMGPDVKLAKRTAIAPRMQILMSPNVARAMRELLQDARPVSALPRTLVEGIVDAVAAEPARPRAYHEARSRLHAIAGRLTRSRHRPKLDAHVLAFRACVIERMTELLEQDAKSLRRARSAGVARSVASNGLGAV
jgi:hypothetical protein